MKAYKHKTSGQHCIEIADYEEKGVLLVSPGGKVQTFAKSHFDDLKECSTSYLLANKLITQEQLNAYQDYMDCMIDDPVENYINYFARSSPDEQKKMLHEFMKMFGEELL